MVSRGQIIVVDFAVAGMPKKIRPVLVVQSDLYNRKMANTIVAMITTNLARAHEPTHLLIDPASAEGKQTGLLHTSVINCNTLTTVRQDELLRVMGTLPATFMVQINRCLKAALDVS